MTTAQELRDMSVTALQELLREKLKDQFVLRMQKATEQQVKTHLFRELRRDIARIKTVLQENEDKA